MKLIKKIGILTIVLIIMAAAVMGAACVRQRQLAQKLIRLHVVAASNSDADQAMKLQVRDRLLACITPLCTAQTDRDETARVLRAQLPMLRQAAEAQLRAQGCSDTVTVTLEDEPFPTRYYDTFALPAGDYLSLRVRIGAAQGHNWWCVCFPTLCTAATGEDFAAVAAGGGFTDDEIDWMQRDGSRYHLRFWLLEQLQSLLN